MAWIFRLALALVGLVIVAVAVVLLMPADRIAQIAEQRFEAATGRAMTISGGVSPKLWPVLGVETGAMSIANADWSDEGPMLTAESLVIGVDAAALIRGEIRIKNVEATAPRIILERAADGKGNWQIGAADPGAAEAPVPGADTAPAEPIEGETETAPETGPRFFSLDLARIEDGAILYIDRRDGSRSALFDIDAELQLPDFNGRAELEFSGLMNGQRIDTTTVIDGFSTFLANGAVPVSVRGDIGSSEIAFDGRAGLAPLAASGRVDADLGNLSGPFGILGMAPPSLPGGLGDDIAIAGDITFAGQTLNLRDARVNLSGTALTGAADVALGDKPKVTARIAAGDLDLSAFAGGSAGSGSAAATGSASTGANPQATGAPPSTGWPTSAIDASALQALDLDLSLSADSLNLGILRFGRVSTVTQLNDGRAVTEISEMQGYGGALSGSFVVNSRGGLSTRINLAGRGIDMNALLQALAETDRLASTGDFSVNLLGVGSSVDAIMKSLDGDASVRLAGGEMRGINLERMLRNLDPSAIGDGQATPLESATASFAVAGGVAQTGDLRLVTPAATASGTGTIGLGARTLDLRLIPSLGAEQDINVPVVIRGPWSDPAVTLDLEAVAREEIDEEIENLRIQAEDAVRDRIGQELGVETQTGDTIDDVLRRGVEDRAVEGINNLLGDILGGN